MSVVIGLDGSEVAGQILRAALALSLATKKPFLVENLQSWLNGSAMRPDLLACVRAAQAVSGAQVEGLEPGSAQLVFEPGALRPGRYLLDAGSKGSVGLLLQTIGIPLALINEPSTLKLRGGTHVAQGPAFPYLSLLWMPLLNELGYDFDIELNAAGFDPEGGGEVTANLRPPRPPVALDKRGRGTLKEVLVLSTVSHVPFSVASEQSERVLHRLRASGILAEAENVPVPAPRSHGYMCLIAAVFERGRAGFCGLASDEAQAKSAADEAAQALVAFMQGRGAVDRYLADQILLPMALASAGLQGTNKPIGRFTAPSLTPNLLAVASTIEKFLEVEVAILGRTDELAEVEIRVAPRNEGLMATLSGSANS